MGILQPAQEGELPVVSCAPKLAPTTGNGYFLLQPSLPPREVMVVRGALVLVAPARPATSLGHLYFFAPSTLALTKMFCSVRYNLLNVLFRPTPVFAPIHPNLL